MRRGRFSEEQIEHSEIAANLWTNIGSNCERFSEYTLISKEKQVDFDFATRSFYSSPSRPGAQSRTLRVAFCLEPSSSLLARKLATEAPLFLSQSADFGV